MNSNLIGIKVNGNGTSKYINSKVSQSPLSGISDRVFRKLIRRWAPDSLLYTEMIYASYLEQGKSELKLKEIIEEEGPIGVQLYDYRPDAMAIAAKKAEDAGAFLIDINMGCPAKKITKKRGGSGLLLEPELAANIVNKVSNSVNIPVTVKTRLGWCENSSDTLSFALKMQSAGAKLLTIHGRTRQQQFQGKADWEKIAMVKEKISIPLIANGDINSIDAAIKCLNVTKSDGIMIGRGSLYSPWLVGEIDAVLKGNESFTLPSLKEKVCLILEHLQELLDCEGEHGLLIARKHINWRCRGFPGSTELRHQLMRSSCPKEAIKILENTIVSL